MSEQNNTFLRALELARTNWVHAIHILRGAADENPDDVRFQIAMGDIFASRNVYDKALQHYLVALSVDPGNQQVSALVANSYLSNGDYRLALAYYKKILKPTDDLLYNKSIAEAFLGKHEDCIATLLEILPRFSSHPFIYYLLVEQHYYLGENQKALDYIEAGKRRAGENMQLYLLSALVYANMKRYLLAYYQFLLADNLNPIQNPDHLLHYGKSAHESGLWQEAISIYERVTDRHPYISAAWAEIIRIYIEKEDYKLAKKYLNKAKKTLDRPSSVIRLLQESLKDVR